MKELKEYQPKGIKAMSAYEKFKSAMRKHSDINKKPSSRTIKKLSPIKAGYYDVSYNWNLGHWYVQLYK